MYNPELALMISSFTAIMTLAGVALGYFWAYKKYRR